MSVLAASMTEIPGKTSGPWSAYGKDLVHLAARTIRSATDRAEMVTEDRSPPCLGMLIDGWAIRYKLLPNGRRQILGFLLPGDIFGVDAVLLGRNDCSIESLTAVRYSQIGQDDFNALQVRSPATAELLIRAELAQTTFYRQWIVSLGQRSASERIAHLFCEIVTRLEARSELEQISWAFPITQNELADATGLTPVHVNRVLQMMRKNGWIELRGKALSLIERTALERLAMFDPRPWSTGSTLATLNGQPRLDRADGSFSNAESFASRPWAS